MICCATFGGAAVQKISIFYVCCVHLISQEVDSTEVALLYSLVRSEACRQMYTGLSKAQDGKSKRWNSIMQANSSELEQKLASLHQCTGLNVQALIYHALLVSCMVPAAHPNLRLFCTPHPAVADSVMLQPFYAGIHKQVHEVPGLDPSHPASRAVLRTILPGVGFLGEADRIIPERVVTMAKIPCLE